MCCFHVNTSVSHSVIIIQLCYNILSLYSSLVSMLWLFRGCWLPLGGKTLCRLTPVLSNWSFLTNFTNLSGWLSVRFLAVWRAVGGHEAWLITRRIIDLVVGRSGGSKIWGGCLVVWRQAMDWEPFYLPIGRSWLILQQTLGGLSCSLRSSVYLIINRGGLILFYFQLSDLFFRTVYSLQNCNK